MIRFRNKPFGSWAVNNATSGRSDSQHKPSRVQLLSQTKWAMCALQMKQVLDLSRTATHHSIGKNVPDVNYKLFQTSCLLLIFIIYNVILGNTSQPLHLVLDTAEQGWSYLRLKKRTEKTIPNPSPDPEKITTDTGSMINASLIISNLNYCIHSSFSHQQLALCIVNMYLNTLSFYTKGGLQDCVFLRALVIYD